MRAAHRGKKQKTQTEGDIGVKNTKEWSRT